MMSNKIANKLSGTHSNRKTIRRIHTETDESQPYRKTQLSNRGSERHYSRQKQPIPYSKIQLKEIPNNNRKTFKINTYKHYQMKHLKTQPNELPRKVTSQSKEKSHPQNKYKIDGVAGKGTFGTVYFGHVRGNGQKIAVKKVHQDKRYKNRQLQILKLIKNPCLLDIRDHFITKQGDREYLNVVMDYYPCNLYQAIRKKELTYSVNKIILYQMLRGLNYLRTLSIAHRDIKPQNILFDTTTNKAIICDFGSAKQLIEGEPNLAYICSRCYRAPELIFGATNYTTQIDMWSLGCVLVEMINGQPPFIGDSQIDQLIEIIKVLGTPSKAETKEMNENYDLKEYSKFPQVKKVQWKSLLKTQNSKLIDLVEKMLTYSPKKRLTPAQAIMHPYFDEIRFEEGYKQLLNKYSRIPNLFDFSEDQLKMFNGEQVIPKWAEEIENIFEQERKMNSISVKRPVNKFV